MEDGRWWRGVVAEVGGAHKVGLRVGIGGGIDWVWVAGVRGVGMRVGCCSGAG